jgi:hypothetical protein
MANEGGWRQVATDKFLDADAGQIRCANGSYQSS